MSDRWDKAATDLFGRINDDPNTEAAPMAVSLMHTADAMECSYERGVADALAIVVRLRDSADRRTRDWIDVAAKDIAALRRKRMVLDVLHNGGQGDEGE